MGLRRVGRKEGWRDQSERQVWDPGHHVISRAASWVPAVWRCEDGREGASTRLAEEDTTNKAFAIARRRGGARTIDHE